MDVTIVIVSYNVADFLNECLVSIKKETTCEYEIIVVDNNSKDSSVEVVKAYHPDVKLRQIQSNIGFVKANNEAFKVADGRYIFMLNPDTVVLDGAIDKLVQFMDEHQEVGACGPKNLNPDLSLQHNCHHFPTAAMRLIEHFRLARKYPRNRLFGKEFMTYWHYNEIKEVEWITGCSLLLRKTALNQVGYLDENYFMYSEETDICYRVNKAGWKVIFYPGAEIIHYQGKSSSNLKEEELISNSVLKHLFNSKYYFFKKNYSCINFVLLKLIDFIFYSMVFVKNIFRRDEDIRRVRLKNSSAVLSLILLGH